MAITRSAKKAIRSSANKRVYNLRRSRAMKGVLKEANTLIATGKKADAEALLPKVYQAVDKAAKRGVIKKNTADRTKSRLMARLMKWAK